MASPAKGLIQTIDFSGLNAPADMTLSIAGVTLDITKDMSSVQIANMVQAALITQYPPSSGTTITPVTTSKFAIQFAPANAVAKPLKLSYQNKPTPAMISELSKYSTDPVLMQGVSIDPKGQLAATYSNGATYTMGFLELANFANDGGLKDIGGNRFVQTGASGQPVITAAGAPKAGNIMSGALEQANVDITSELMDMIRAQQVYNGNARVLQTTVDTVTKITDLR
jgi:flagellar hook-basal body protein